MSNLEVWSLTQLYQTSLSVEVDATPSNFGRYDPFFYKDWRYPLDARNKSENRHTANCKAQEAQTVLQKRMPLEIRDRLVEPDYLCFLNTRRRYSAE